MCVIFEKMQLPAGCAVCRFEDAGECVALGTPVGCYRKLTDKRFPLCPLTGLPPHGDLIDRDALIAAHTEEEGGIYTVGWSRFLRRFENAPAVIPGNLPEEEEA